MGQPFPIGTEQLAIDTTTRSSLDNERRDTRGWKRAPDDIATPCLGLDRGRRPRAPVGSSGNPEPGPGLGSPADPGSQQPAASVGTSQRAERRLALRQHASD
ncbi:MAG TPA: hypothetical protein VFX61_03025 [Micromonosporaceae bacterium]|nr:hypothetical protein [Micromonosporaceae bacterium]